MTCIPRRAVIYVSDTYGGLTNDWQVIERLSLQLLGMLLPLENGYLVNREVGV